MEQPVEIKRFQNRMQAEMAIGVLEGCGIECEIWADDLGGLGPGQSFVQGVRIFVDAKDTEEAQSVLSGEDSQ